MAFFVERTHRQSSSACAAKHLAQQLAQSGQLTVNSAPQISTKILRSAAAPFIVLLPYRPLRIHAFYVEWPLDTKV